MEIVHCNCSLKIVSNDQGNNIQILTAQSDDGGNYHSQGAVHTGPSITPDGGAGGGDGRAGMNSTEGLIISTIIRLQSSQYLFYIPHP